MFFIVTILPLFGERFTKQTMRYFRPIPQADTMQKGVLKFARFKIGRLQHVEMLFEEVY